MRFSPPLATPPYAFLRFLVSPPSHKLNHSTSKEPDAVEGIEQWVVGDLDVAPRSKVVRDSPDHHAADKRATKVTAFDRLANGLAGVVVLLAFLWQVCPHLFQREWWAGVGLVGT